VTNLNQIIFVAGHKGMVGSAVVRRLQELGYNSIVTAERNELDLKNAEAVAAFFAQKNIDIVVDAAAKVGGILANDTYPYDFLMDNMLIQNNLIEASIKNDVSKFIFLGSSCIYPKFAPQPIKEEHLLTDSLEPTNQWYAIAKISGVYACRAARKQFGFEAVSLMPTNLYGPNDNFNLDSSHVLPAMMRKFHEAKENNNAAVTLWGSGTPLREFLHVDDLAKAVVFAINNKLEDDLYNVGFGSDVSIKDLAELVQKVVGHQGDIIWDLEKPDGTPKKLMDSSRFRALGWEPAIDLSEGVKSTYIWFINNYNNLRG
jgi:GDP-L-fucose synthase